MANKRKCKNCGKMGRGGVVINMGYYCDHEGAIKFAQANAGKALEKHRKKLSREFNVQVKKEKKAVRRRSEWYEMLQTVVNKHVRLTGAGGSCCTCRTTNPAIKYDAGHFLSVGARPELRFELTNIHLQCSVQCNVHGSGMRHEYNAFILDKYGQDHLDWLIGPHPTLKDQFPTHADIEAEIKRYRVLNRNITQT